MVTVHTTEICECAAPETTGNVWSKGSSPIFTGTVHKGITAAYVSRVPTHTQIGDL